MHQITKSELLHLSVSLIESRINLIKIYNRDSLLLSVLKLDSFSSKIYVLDAYGHLVLRV